MFTVLCEPSLQLSLVYLSSLLLTLSLPTNHYPANTAVPYQNNSCENGAIRIVGNKTEQTIKGRVEVCLRGVWGTICGVHWTDLDAAVVCNQSGYAVTGESSRVLYLFYALLHKYIHSYVHAHVHVLHV